MTHFVNLPNPRRLPRPREPGQMSRCNGITVGDEEVVLCVEALVHCNNVILVIIVVTNEDDGWRLLLPGPRGSCRRVAGPGTPSRAACVYCTTTEEDAASVYAYTVTTTSKQLWDEWSGQGGGCGECV